MSKDLQKKYLIIKRKGCIGCGACVMASENKCYFVNGKSWCVKEEIKNADEVISVCPVNVIEAATLEEYEAEEAKLKKDGEI